MFQSGECFSLKANIFPKEEKFLNEWENMSQSGDQEIFFK
jgi:hypothetical protein